MPRVTVPAAVHIQRHEHDYPESVARGFYQDLRVFERLEEGGHFTIAEVPDAMAQPVPLVRRRGAGEVAQRPSARRSASFLTYSLSANALEVRRIGDAAHLELRAGAERCPARPLGGLRLARDLDDPETAEEFVRLPV